MIGTAIRKFAKERGLTCDNGFAYGTLHGLHVFMNEGEGWKAIYIYLHPPVENTVENAELCARVIHTLSDCDLKEARLHREGAISTDGGFARLVFHDTIGTMKRIEHYLDEKLPGLAALGIDSNRCAWCGEPLDGDLRYSQLNACVLPVHSGCVQELSSQVERIEEEDRSKGSVVRGAVGAVIGAVIGAIPWALVFMLGYIAGLLGLLIGWLANLFYDKFGGRRSGLKVPVLIFAVIIGILLGQIGGYTLLFAKQYDEYGMADYDYTRQGYVQMLWEQYLIYDQETALTLEYERAVADLPEEERVNLMTVEEFIDTYYDTELDELRTDMRAEFMKNMLLGLFFAALGCVRLLMNTHQANRRKKVKALK
ncbi:MAG: hypothetical protein IJ466_05500 [Clostridia bacterium]|nr:hypothetical protein [Clostridia bacterium]